MKNQAPNALLHQRRIPRPLKTTQDSSIDGDWGSGLHGTLRFARAIVGVWTMLTLLAACEPGGPQGSGGAGGAGGAGGNGGGGAAPNTCDPALGTIMLPVPPIPPLPEIAAGANAVESADFNGDKLDDLAVADSDGLMISIWLSQGNGTFGPKLDYPLAVKPWFMKVGDLNGDHRPDLIVPDVTNGISVFMNDGNGKFDPKVDYNLCAFADITLADVNGDGKLDIAGMCGWSPSTIGVWLNQGNGTFGPATIQPSTGYDGYGFKEELAAADLNGDGKDDLVVGDDSLNVFPTGTVYVFLNDGNGAFGTAAKHLLSQSSYAKEPTVADMNGDGRADIAVLDSDSVSVLLNNGNGTFGPRAEYPIPIFAESLNAGDLDRDGHPDLVTTHSMSSSMSVLLNTGAGTFGAPTTYSTRYEAVDGTIGDFNGDGHLDIAVVNAAQGNLSTLRMFLNQGDGTFPPDEASVPASTNLYATSGYTVYSVAVADFNGDGQTDVVAGTNDNVNVLLNQGGGILAPHVDYFVDRDAAVVAADFNGDGVSDIAVSHPWRVSVYQNPGNGTFGTPVDYLVGSGLTTSIVATDLDGDGLPDLAVAGHTRSETVPPLNEPSSNAVSILLNQGNGTFGPSMDIAFSGTYQSGTRTTSNAWLAAADMNADGLQDLLYTHYDSGTLYLLRNQGGGMFSNEETFNFVRPVGVATGDLNADGSPDVVVTSWDELYSYLHVMLNQGNGTLAPPVSYRSRYATNSLAIADLDGDGNLDVVETNGIDDHVLHVWHNLGNGTFDKPDAYLVGGDRPYSIAIADLDGDTRLDLVVALQDSNNVAVMFNRPCVP